METKYHLSLCFYLCIHYCFHNRLVQKVLKFIKKHGSYSLVQNKASRLYGPRCM